MIGKIQRIPLREIWRHEAIDFTKWLEENIDVLTEILDISLTNVEREQRAGSFNIDLVAEDEAGNPVIIENQLGKSDHDHLGKVLTYLTAYEAKTAIWIVADPRPEHVSVVTWLNESTPARFYLLKIEAIRIGDSLPAPLLTVIVGPGESVDEIGDAKKEIAERYVLRQRFWKGLLDLARQKSKLHASVSPSQYSWIGAGSGKSGISFNYSTRQHDAKVELYIDRGKDSEQENKLIFDFLAKHKEEIESAFVESLNWERLNNRRASRISYLIDAGGYRDEERWDEIYELMVDAMVRLEKSLKPFIAKVDTDSA